MYNMRIEELVQMNSYREPVHKPVCFNGIATQEFPITNLIWVGLHSNEKGLFGYTARMRNFGYDEMDGNVEPMELLDFLTSIANYVILEDVLLQDGETISFTADQQLALTKSHGVTVEGDSLKIEY